MKHQTKASSLLLCLTTFWSTQFGAAVQASEPNQAPAGAPPQFAAASPQLDITPAPKIKPFTLGASQVFVQGRAQDQFNDQGKDPFQNDPLKADTNFTLDPKNRPPLSGDVNTNRFNLQASEAVRLLARYNVELFVDRSQSMGRRDCPDGLSRWEWCGQQATSLAQAINPLVPQGLTIVPFATEYDVFQHADAQNISSLFDSMKLQSGTRLYEPMAEQFDTYFANHAADKKPLLIVVITDGVPAPQIEPVMVRNELVAASNRQKSAHEVTVIFCQIGSQDAGGQAYLQDLDQNLSSYGARYDIVHTITFDALQQDGLGPALAASLQKFAPPPPEPVILTAKQAPKAAHAKSVYAHVARSSGGGGR